MTAGKDGHIGTRGRSLHVQGFHPMLLWDAHLLFIQKDEAHNHYVDVSPYGAIFEQTGDLGDTQTHNVITYHY